VVGAGIMGHGVAQVFAANRCNVILLDLSGERLKSAVQWIRENLDYMAELGAIRPEDIEVSLERIQPSTNLDDSARKVEFVFEAVSEDFKLKQGLSRVEKNPKQMIPFLY